MTIRLEIIFAIASAFVLTAIPEIFAYEIDDSKLPSNVKPFHYNVSLQPNLKKAKVYGYVGIDLEVTAASSRIILHACELVITDVQIFHYRDRRFRGEYKSEVSGQFLIITSKKEFEIGLYTIDIDYTGVLNDVEQGLYRDSYVNEYGETKWFVTSQFKPTGARRAFPCFDDPASKATFDMNLARDGSYNSISNMKLAHTWHKRGNIFADVFEQSPLMATYQIALVISDFDHIFDNESFRLFARRQVIASGDAELALKLSPKVLAELKVYTDVPFSQDKVDQALLPRFCDNGKANWGLAIYSEQALLWNQSTSLSIAKQKVLLHISHAFVHQWFSNPITPRWWNGGTYSWLKEGFAAFLSFEVAEMVKPEWRIEDQLLQRMHWCFAADLKLPKLTRWDKESGDEIIDVFDGISHTKAGLVLRMFQHAISPGWFKHTVTRYLENMQFRAAESTDLWKSTHEILRLSAIYIFPGDLSASDVMTTWEEQPGYPLITVTRDYDGGPTTFKQETFPEGESDRRWYVPISWTSESSSNYVDTHTRLWISNDTITNTGDTNLASTEWLLVNPKVTGYYRVNYDYKNWILLTNYLNTTDYIKIHPLNRAQLINDAFNLARFGFLEYFVPLDLTNYLHRETDYIVHISLFRALKFLNKMAATTPFYHHFQKHVAMMLNTTLNKLGYEEIGFDDDEHINNVHRGLVIQWACQFHHKACRKITTSKLSNISSISADLQSSIICAGLRAANRDTWDMVDEYSKTVTGAAQSRVISALGCAENNDILMHYVEREMARNNVKVFENIYSKGDFGKEFVWTYLIVHFDKIHQKFGRDTGEIIVGLSDLLTDPVHISTFKMLKKANPDLTESFSKALITMRGNFIWINVWGHRITAWILNRFELYYNENFYIGE